MPAFSFCIARELITLQKLHPTRRLRRIWEITKSMLDDMGVTALILDVDNTLTTHNNPHPDEKVLEWLRVIRQQGIRLVLVSNNRSRRIRPFAEMLGLEYTANALKPLGKGFRQAARRVDARPGEIGVVGDQVFTDVLGGNLFGAKTILVEPMEEEDKPFFRVKRSLELRALRNYRER